MPPHIFSLSLLLVLYATSMSIMVIGASTNETVIPLGSSISTSTTKSWFSSSGRFAFGFYPDGEAFAIGVWLVSGDTSIIVWTANRDDRSPNFWWFYYIGIQRYTPVVPNSIDSRYPTESHIWQLYTGYLCCHAEHRQLCVVWHEPDGHLVYLWFSDWYFVARPEPGSQLFPSLSEKKTVLRGGITVTIN